jgi:hypothetical protein
MIQSGLYISDLLGPLWLALIFIFLIKKGVSKWKAWGIASTFCLAQAYIVAKTVGWNLGGYFIVITSSIPSIIFGKQVITEELNSYMFWIIPPITLIVIPSIGFLIVSKYSEKLVKIQ